eukprot:TRINITY_DN1987_c1_g2_i1.p1 TRINITY_DN1987_c1_g2~~TRINITY_DN1987_c1_g2_i1.p1  ORF type:complete len:257 (+),score=70.08 TRINITY_DN1987_c1_g2_i1:178-948(+)
MGIEFPRLPVGEGGRSDRRRSPHVLLKVSNLSRDIQPMYFRIRRTSTLRRLMAAYCARIQVEQRQARLQYRDSYVSDLRTTPDQLEMEDGDQLNVVLHATPEQLAAFFGRNSRFQADDEEDDEEEEKEDDLEDSVEEDRTLRSIGDDGGSSHDRQPQQHESEQVEGGEAVSANQQRHIFNSRRRASEIIRRSYALAAERAEDGQGLHDPPRLWMPQLLHPHMMPLVINPSSSSRSLDAEDEDRDLERQQTLIQLDD